MKHKNENEGNPFLTKHAIFLQEATKRPDPPGRKSLFATDAERYIRG